MAFNENELGNNFDDQKYYLGSQNGLTEGDVQCFDLSLDDELWVGTTAGIYVFDEIDAALDIMNCEKLGKLIRKNAHKAQYVVVSHSEHFIQSAQTIYGVTMDKNKISGVLSLDLKNMGNYVDSDAANVEE